MPRSARSWAEWERLRGVIARGVVAILDGATGTEIERRAGPEAMHNKGWSCLANLTHPDVVRDVHLSYLEAGSHLIIANTYATNGNVMRAAGLGSRAEEATRRGVELALEARSEHVRRHGESGTPVLVAGSVSCHPPLMPEGAEIHEGVWPPEEDECRELAQHCHLLEDCGVDVIVVEMVWDLEHGMRAVEAACSTALPVILSIAYPTPFRGDLADHARTVLQEGLPLQLAGGVTIEEATAALTAARSQIVAVAVHHTQVDFVLPALRAVRSAGWKGVLGVYPEHGSFRMPHWVFEPLDPDEFAQHAAGWVKECRVQMVGGCCGVGPQHIAALTKAQLQVEALSLHEAASSLDAAGLAMALAAAENINEQDCNGRTPLHVGVEGGNLATVTALLDSGADTTLRDNKGHTPLDLAVLKRARPLMQHLRFRAQGRRECYNVVLTSHEEALGLSLRQTDCGVRITGLVCGSPTARAGVRPGRIVTLFDRPVVSLVDVKEAVGEAKRCGLSFPLVVQLDAAPECGAEHTMQLVWNVPEAYKDEVESSDGVDLAIACNICNDDDLQNAPHGFYHCHECQYDVCLECAVVSDMETGRRVEVIQDLVVNAKRAVKAGSVAEVTGIFLADKGQRRIVIQPRSRIDGKTGHPLGVLPFEVCRTACDVKGHHVGPIHTNGAFCKGCNALHCALDYEKDTTRMCGMCFEPCSRSDGTGCQRTHSQPLGGAAPVYEIARRRSGSLGTHDLVKGKVQLASRSFTPPPSPDTSSRLAGGREKVRSVFGKLKDPFTSGLGRFRKSQNSPPGTALRNHETSPAGSTISPMTSSVKAMSDGRRSLLNRF